MNWNAVTERHKKRFDREFVSCEESYERRFLVDIILDQFPWLEHAQVSAAVQHCCEISPGPKPSELFIRCLRNRLE